MSATAVRDAYVDGLIDRHGRDVYERLARARVAYTPDWAGSAPTSHSRCTRLGVGHLRLIDFDIVEDVQPEPPELPPAAHRHAEDRSDSRS